MGLAGLLAAACTRAGGDAAGGGDLHELVVAEGRAPAAAAPALRFEHIPDAASVVADRERRDAVIVGPGSWSWRLRVPPAGRLRGAVQVAPGTVEGGGVQTTVTVTAGGSEELLEVIRLPGAAAADDPGWVGLDLDLTPWSGREVELGFSSMPWGGAGGEPRLAWAPLRVISAPAPAASPAEPPSILLIVADTLRRDRVGAYPGAASATPEIRRLLAAPGLVFERAYAQAPWTPPSVASYLTGRPPDEALAPGGGLSPDVPTLAELLRGRGYRTAAFVANPILGGEGGYERGFESYFAAGEEDGWSGVRAEELTARAAAWLSGHSGERFFLYVHYIDPHSPYDSPWDEAPGEETPASLEVGDLRWGRADPTDAESAARIAARYDAEVRYLDAAVGGLIEALAPETLARTLLVFTADHGEELLDHGWWGHGRTLYDELIHVPLLMRWDGRLPVGRVEGVVRLIDLVPTLTAAAGAPPPEGVAGVDLWPDLVAGRAPPRLTATAQHLHLGPRRATAVRDGLKLILFDREAPAVGDHPRLDFTVDLDRRLLARFEAYDLLRDPRERHNLAASEPWPPEVAALEEEIHRILQRRLPGLRMVARGLPAGARLRARVRCTPAPGDLAPYFLAPGDRARRSGDELHLDLGAEALAKGVVVGSGCERVEAVEAALERPGGAPPAAALALRVADRPWTGVPVTRAELTPRADWPSAAGGPALDLWYSMADAPPAAPPHDDDEWLERLRALGYLGG